MRLDLDQVILVLFQRLFVRDLHHPLADEEGVVGDLPHLDVDIALGPLLALLGHVELVLADDLVAVGLPLGDDQVEDELLLVVVLVGGLPAVELVHVAVDAEGDVDAEELLLGHDRVEDNLVVALLDVLEDFQALDGVAALEIAVEVALEGDHQVLVLDVETGLGDCVADVLLDLVEHAAASQQKLDRDRFVQGVQRFDDFT